MKPVDAQFPPPPYNCELPRRSGPADPDRYKGRIGEIHQLLSDAPDSEFAAWHLLDLSMKTVGMALIRVRFIEREDPEEWEDLYQALQTMHRWTAKASSWPTWWYWDEDEDEERDTLEPQV